MSRYQLIFDASQLPSSTPAPEHYIALCDESPSGMRWRSGETILQLTFGSCSDEYCVWPPDEAEQYKGQHVFPLSYQCHVQTGWKIEPVGSAWEVEREMQWFPAASVREYLQTIREIELLEAVVKRGRATQQSKKH